MAGRPCGSVISCSSVRQLCVQGVAGYCLGESWLFTSRLAWDCYHGKGRVEREREGGRELERDRDCADRDPLNPQS